VNDIDYPAVIADMRRRGDAYYAAAAEVQRLAGIEEPPQKLPFKFKKAKRGQTKKGRAKAGAGDDVIFAVVLEGADTLKKIVAAAKVKNHVAAAAVRRLLAAKRIRKEGATVNLRYLAPKK
jgi:hypothetical protein